MSKLLRISVIRPDLIFEKDGKRIGVEVTCLYDQIKIGNDKISEKGA